jgi:hypothetical protein
VDDSSFGFGAASAVAITNVAHQLIVSTIKR